jgi:hypothetical protein
LEPASHLLLGRPALLGEERRRRRPQQLRIHAQAQTLGEVVGQSAQERALLRRCAREDVSFEA